MKVDQTMTKTQLKANLTGLVILLVGSTIAITATGGRFSHTPIGLVVALIAGVVHLFAGGLMHAADTLFSIFTMLFVFSIPLLLIAAARITYRRK